MAVTRIADVIVPEVFDPYTTERSTELAKLYSGGIIANDAAFDKLAQTGGKLINMPFWNDLTGTDEVLSDTSGLTPTGITASQDVAVLFMRGKSWGANDLAASLSGDDPMRQIAELVADFWARRMQALLLDLVTGVFADNTANDSADMTLDISHATDGGLATAANKISASAVIDAAGTMGDAASTLTAMIMHSVVYQNLQKQNLITYTPVSTQSAQIPTYLGHRVLVDDSIPRTVSGTGYKYPVYIFGDGAVAMGNGNARYPSETGRNQALGEDYLYSRRHFILHPRGVAFQSSSVVGSSPTNAEVALAANWNRVWHRKHVRIARLIVNG